MSTKAYTKNQNLSRIPLRFQISVCIFDKIANEKQQIKNVILYY